MLVSQLVLLAVVAMQLLLLHLPLLHTSAAKTQPAATIVLQFVILLFVLQAADEDSEDHAVYLKYMQAEAPPPVTYTPLKLCSVCGNQSP